MSNIWNETEKKKERKKPPHIWKSWQAGGATSEQNKADYIEIRSISINYPKTWK